MVQSEWWITAQVVANMIGLVIAVAGIILTYLVAKSRQNFELRRAHTDEIRETLKEAGCMSNPWPGRSNRGSRD